MNTPILVALLSLLAASASAKTFPYAVHKKTLDNGLDVVVIETPEFKDVLSYNTLVLAGARNEVEPGKTGLAHLFEHILFRHRYGGKDGGYDDAMSRLGTHNNAWTWFDVTYYHPLSFTWNLESGPKTKGLPGLIELEAARFTALDFTEKTFKTEAGAVLGEYRRGASSPSQKLSERQSALMFPHHPYGHTTIGTYEDVVDMPNEYQAARAFYDDYYRPNNCALIVAGDVRAGDVFKRVEPRYKAWKPKTAAPITAKGSPPAKPQREHVAWEADVAPLVWVSQRMPAFVPGTAEAAAAQLLGELLVSPAAPLYKKLRYEKQTVSALEFAEGGQEFESFDPRSLTLSAQLYKEKHASGGQAYFDEVVADMTAGLERLKGFSKEPGAAELLAKLKSKYRYDFLGRLESPESIASTFAWYYRFGRDPDVLEKLLAAVERLTPADIDAVAAKYFTPESRVVLTLAYAPPAKAAGGKGR